MSKLILAEFVKSVESGQNSCGTSLKDGVNAEKAAIEASSREKGGLLLIVRNVGNRTLNPRSASR